MKFMKRMKGLFGPYNITFANKETVLELNGCTLETGKKTKRIDCA